jgi:hypothetical protein
MTSHPGMRVRDRGGDAKIGVENSGGKPLGNRGVIAWSSNTILPSFNVPQSLGTNRWTCLTGACGTLLVALAPAGEMHGDVKLRGKTML